MKLSNRLRIQAAGINLLLFCLLLPFCHSLYNTNEDVFALYYLSGGFGAPPTALLHYNYGLHPLPGLLLKQLFLLTGSINWYTLLLYGAHYTACCIFLYRLLQQHRPLTAYLLYLLIFSCFVSINLLTPNFSNAAIALGSGALLLLTGQPAKPRKNAATALALLLIAACFRIHVLVPLVVIALPFLLLYTPARMRWLRIGTLALAAGGIILMNQWHQGYYRAHISGWQQEEDYRQQNYAFYNDHTLRPPAPGQPWYVEYYLRSPFVDTAFLSTQKLQEMYHSLNGSRETRLSFNREAGYWLLINNRVYFLALLLLVLYAGRHKKTLAQGSLAIALLLAATVYLLLFRKIPGYWLISCCWLISLFLAVSAGAASPLSCRLRWLYGTGALLLISWGLLRWQKTNRQQQESISAFKTAYARISRQPGTLFISVTDRFPLQYFGAFDPPRNYPLLNFLGAEHFMHNNYRNTYARFGIADTQAIPGHTNVIFWGQQVPALADYFRIRTHRPVQLTVIDSIPQGYLYHIRFSTTQPSTNPQP
ncbi:MAG: hypothetical protein P0Y53_11850 [Candidatus Pseudobacter hemicellulosilyticus]|uniref:Uncharacterized protein n=1 Tax=Candidatus Pseudobacter hemicellulosilyticus TaxID=3121375 RepID=A0AAJ5X159_9BACT|nr:MAG: hypothetical protein P0Y53_11850 [Pseudobacter sp.]